MTIAVSLKIDDGLVLAADSATTLVQENNGQFQASNVYNNANKIFNLHKNLPIGAITWGVGSVGRASISTLVKDFRQQFSQSPEKLSVSVDAESYSVGEIAKAFRAFIYEEHYVPNFAQFGDTRKPALGFIVGGYSTDSSIADEFQIDILEDGSCGEPLQLRPNGISGASWAGQPEALNRLFSGFSASALAVFEEDFGLSSEVIQDLSTRMRAKTEAPLINSAMPLQDAIDLARFMVQVTADWCRFSPGAQTVGGPTEIAAITRHEGFRWIERKHYYKRELNDYPYTPGGGNNERSSDSNAVWLDKQNFRNTK